MEIRIAAVVSCMSALISAIVIWQTHIVTHSSVDRTLGYLQLTWS